MDYQDEDAFREALSIDEDLGDDLLQLVLIACHPVLSTDARVAVWNN